MELTFWTEPDAVCVEVVDHGEWQIPPGQPTGRGRGIEIMQRLVAFVMIRHDRHGTRVLLRHSLLEAPVTALHLASDTSVPRATRPGAIGVPGS